MKKLLVLCAVLLVLPCVALAEALKRDENTSIHPYETLKGIEKLCIFVNYFQYRSRLERSERELIVKKIEDNVKGELENTGIEIQSNRASYSPCLFVDIFVMGDEGEDSIATLLIKVYLKQLVYLKSNPDISSYATTWGDGHVLQKVESNKINNSVNNTVIVLIDSFLDRYFQVNPMQPINQQAINPNILKLDNFIIEEYPLNIRKWNEPSIGSSQQLSEEILAKRAELRELDRESRYNKKRTSMNEKLAPFGYRLTLTEVTGWQEHYHSDLYRDKELLIQNFTPHSLVINESKTDFALFAGNTPNVRPHNLKIQKNEIQRYRGYAIYPVFLGDDFLTVEWEDTSIPTSQLWTYKVKYRNEILCTGKANNTFDAMRSLFVKDGHWILEVDRQVIIDGKNLNQQLGYDKIFRYVYYKDKPLYFFEKNGEISISYNRKVLPVIYKKVPHYPCCSSPGIGVNEDMFWFYGLRDDTWYYVEMGIYE